MTASLPNPAAARRAAPAAPPAAGARVVAVRLGRQEFALDIMSVREIRGWSPPIPLPGAPAYVQGVSDLRGLVIPIVDLAARLGLAPTVAGANSVVVVAEVRGRLVGLLVEAVSDLLEVDPSRLQPTPEIGGAEPSNMIQGLFDIDGRILGLVAIDALVPPNLPVADGLPAADGVPAACAA